MEKCPICKKNSEKIRGKDGYFKCKLCNNIYYYKTGVIPEAKTGFFKIFKKRG